MRAVRRRSGRRPGGPDTRGEILTAARVEFGERGYDGATMRAIGARAGVDPALVHHYFGAKEQLFLAAMEIPFDPATTIAATALGPAEDLGERVARVFLQIWADPVRRAPLLALIRSAMTHEAAATLLRQFVSRVLLPRVAGVLEGAPDRELRAEAMISHLVGVAMLRFVVKVEPIASVSEDELVALVAPVIQRYVQP
ncbi:MAG TPA: TetR family transcriptional regulator [Jiangellaceae bacterium]